MGIKTKDRQPETERDRKRMRSSTDVAILHDDLEEEQAVAKDFMDLEGGGTRKLI